MVSCAMELKIKNMLDVNKTSFVVYYEHRTPLDEHAQIYTAYDINTYAHMFCTQ